MGRTNAEAEVPVLTWCEEPTRWKRPWCWKRLKVREGGNRGDGWMASPTLWTWVWVNSGSRWWTRRPGVLWFMGSQRFRHDWATELNWAALCGPVIRTWCFCFLWPRFNPSLGNWHLRSCTVQPKKKKKITLNFKMCWKVPLEESHSPPPPPHPQSQQQGRS